MTTLFHLIDLFVDKIAVTDKQEKKILSSVNNITSVLLNNNSLNIKEVFLNGSYERDTNIRPLDDIDVFAVLSKDNWVDKGGMLPNPQSVLSKIKSVLENKNDYLDKVKQDRPCVTVCLSDKAFDILPAFQVDNVFYKIPNFDLKTWMLTSPKQLSADLNNANTSYNNKLKIIIKVIKYWNRLNTKIAPSYHIEELAINIFRVQKFVTLEQSIREWFNYAPMYLDSTKFRSYAEYQKFNNKVVKTSSRLNNAKDLLDDKKELEAIKIWKEIFENEFPTKDINQAREYGKLLSEGNLKIGSTGLISAHSGTAIAASKGFYGK